MQDIMQTLTEALKQNKEDGGYTLEALLVGAVGVAIILALFDPVQTFFQTVLNAVETFVTSRT